MLSINWSDVWKMVESIKVPLIVIGMALALAIIVSLAVFKMGKPARKLTRSTAWVAALVAVVVAVVSMMYGGFKTVLDLAAGTGALTDASKAQVEDLGNDISDEGMVLLKNNNGALPLAKGSAINVWGWGSTNPIYGGTGSGSLSKDNPTTTLLDGLHNAGFTPMRVTSMPALARPAARAWSRNSPEMRVSRPMIARGLEPSARREPPNWRAAASPSCSARSAVMSTFASPRTPSVPNILGIVSPFSGSID